MAGFREKFRNILKQPDEDADYDDYYSEEEEEQAAPAQQEPAEDYDSAAPAQTEEASDNVINLHDDTKVQFVLFKPESFDKEVTTMADEFVKRNTVILNMEQTNKDIGKRIIDFLSGVAYAHNGKISRVSEDTYIVMPSNVKLSGEDVMDEVESDNIYF
ncbi:MAG: cell division protein SepF [Acutalibacteraceae bacterium]|nr:cell division protein SepF [Clostridia bacterium]MEE3404446.1 cell division protein SepF [Acutalibacteraceae bacterium]